MLETLLHSARAAIVALDADAPVGVASELLRRGLSGELPGD